MIFSTKAEYGVRVMVELARRGGDQPVALTEVAEHEGLPLAYLEHLVARLRRADLVTSRRGAHGGYLLSRDPAQITMAEVVEALEGQIAPIECFSTVPDGSIHCVLGSDPARVCTSKIALVPRARGDRRDARADDARRPDPRPGAHQHGRDRGHHRRPGRRQHPSPHHHDPEEGGSRIVPTQLEIRNLHVRTEEREILRGVDLIVRRGELHALMGPNGSGKSTLANTIMGHPGYEVTDGEILLDGEAITELAPHERAKLGLFLAFQYPVAIPGVSVANFLRLAINAKREEPIKVKEFGQQLRHAVELLDVDEGFTSRHLNDGFSGGEKKRAEVLQMAMLQPDIAVLDETDSGLDIDALRTVAEGVQKLHDEQGLGALIITHYQRILDYVRPQFVHIMIDGRIVMEGGNELVERLEREGYDRIREEVAANAGA